MPQFVADNTVGKLRRWLNLLGYDAIYDPRSCREILADPRSEQECRIVLGRCPTLAARQTYGNRFVHLESEHLEDQIAQIVRMFPLDVPATIFSRCSHCNEVLNGPLGLDAVRGNIPPKVCEWRAEYYRCPRCGNVYWEGTHTERIRKRISAILHSSGASNRSIS